MATEPDPTPSGTPVAGQQNWSAPGGFDRAQESHGGAGESPSGYGGMPSGQGEERKAADEATPVPPPDSEKAQGSDGDERR